jgi:hypothetical protein
VWFCPHSPGLIISTYHGDCLRPFGLFSPTTAFCLGHCIECGVHNGGSQPCKPCFQLACAGHRETCTWCHRIDLDSFWLLQTYCIFVNMYYFGPSRMLKEPKRDNLTWSIRNVCLRSTPSGGGGAGLPCEFGGCASPTITSRGCHAWAVPRASLCRLSTRQAPMPATMVRWDRPCF